MPAGFSPGSLRSPDFAWTARRADDWRKPWADWPGTRYEAKALRDGRVPSYLTFVRALSRNPDHSGFAVSALHEAQDAMGRLRVEVFEGFRMALQPLRLERIRVLQREQGPQRRPRTSPSPCRG